MSGGKAEGCRAPRRVDGGLKQPQCSGSVTLLLRGGHQPAEVALRQQQVSCWPQSRSRACRVARAFLSCDVRGVKKPHDAATPSATASCGGRSATAAAVFNAATSFRESFSARRRDSFTARSLPERAEGSSAQGMCVEAARREASELALLERCLKLFPPLEGGPTSRDAAHERNRLRHQQQRQQLWVTGSDVPFLIFHLLNG